MTIYIAAALAAVLIGFSLGRYRTHLFQNRGEAVVARAIRDEFPPPNYYLLNHVTLPTKDGTTQIDHILISRFGIFVIETKDYSGWIFGSPNDRQWTQVRYGSKFRFQNPIRQNYGHVRAIADLLDFVPAHAVFSAVVFTGDAEFKTDTPDGVFKLKTLLAFVEGHTSEVMSANRVQFCVGRLETARLSVSKATDIEHVQRLRRRFGKDD
jgi:hypothetical protein